MALRDIRGRMGVLILDLGREGVAAWLEVDDEDLEAVSRGDVEIDESRFIEMEQSSGHFQDGYDEGVDGELDWGVDEPVVPDGSGGQPEPAEPGPAEVVDTGPVDTGPDVPVWVMPEAATEPPPGPGLSGAGGLSVGLDGVRVAGPDVQAEPPGFPVRDDPFGVSSITKQGDLGDEWEMRRQSLRRARELAMLTQLPIGLDYHEKVAAIGLVAQIELVLIYCFHESVPDPGGRWDDDRRNREVEKRLARLRWVEREQMREFTGMRGVWNWLSGKTRMTGKDVYTKMVSEADEIMESAAASARERRNRAGISEAERAAGVMKMAGVDFLVDDRPGSQVVEGRPGGSRGK